MEELQAWLSPCHYSTGQAMSGPDAPQAGLQLLLSGRASTYDSARARLDQCGPGDAIWPVDGGQGRAASVVADEPCRTMVLTPEALGGLKKDDERLALKLYRYLLAGRLQADSGGVEPTQE